MSGDLKHPVRDQESKTWFAQQTTKVGKADLKSNRILKQATVGKGKHKKHKLWAIK